MGKQIKKLYRSRSSRILGGVCGGLADYIGIDPTLVRIVYIAISVFSAAFPGILVYLIAWLIIPDEFNQ